METRECKALGDILSRDDVMSTEEANFVASAIDGMGYAAINQFLIDTAMGDGTNNEAKLAAILRGLLLARERDQDLAAERREVE